jgi:hypothetical protein
MRMSGRDQTEKRICRGKKTKSMSKTCEHHIIFFIVTILIPFFWCVALRTHSQRPILINAWIADNKSLCKISKFMGGFAY